jgi:hypothetical protein
MIGAFFKSIVYEDIIVFGVELHFIARKRQSALDDIFRIRPTIPKPRFQFLAVWWHHEDANGVRDILVKLRRPLHVYVN